MTEDRDRERDHHRRRARRLHGCAVHLARRSRAAGDRGLPLGRPAPADDRRRELPGLPRGDHGPGDDAALPRPGGALRHPLRHRGRHARRALARRLQPHRVWVGDDEYQARTVILAMGANHRKLGVPGEEELAARGVSYCATCDAAFFRDKKIAVVGGGDSAMEEAIFLSKFGTTVDVIHRRDEFRASQIMLNRAREIENIEFVTPYARSEFQAERATASLEKIELAAAPRTARRASSRSTARSSRSATSRTRSSSRARSSSTRTATCSPRASRPRRTSPGVFAAGDLVDHTYRQADHGRRARAARPRSTPSGSCATRRPRRTGRRRTRSSATPSGSRRASAK